MAAARQMARCRRIGQPAPARVEFADPHAALAGPVEGEVTRVRKLTGVWRWLLVVATAATILLCINQQFTLRFFVGYTQLNTEYYYLLILCMLPFTFLIFPGSATARRSTGFPGTTSLLFLATVGRRALPDVQRAQGGRARLGVRRRAVAGRSSPGFVMWVLLMEALRRTGGWSLLLERAARSRSIRCLPTRAGSGRCAAASRRSSRRPPTTCSPARACSASRSRPSPRR